MIHIRRRGACVSPALPPPVSTLASRLGEDHPVNQDSAVRFERGPVRAYIVCDGHGDRGEVVSGRVCERLPVSILSSIVDRFGRVDSRTMASAGPVIAHAIGEMDRELLRDMPDVAFDSGCTLAGAIVDVRSRSGVMFSAGDSLVSFFNWSDPSLMGMTALPLQNAANAPASLFHEAERLRESTGMSYVDGAMGEALYMLFPDVNQSRGGLQLYSSLGDFGIKKANRLVKLRPQTLFFSPASIGTGAGETTFVLASDGYTDFMGPRPLSAAWYSRVRSEVSECDSDARCLVGRAVSRGSTDDITVLTFRL